MDADFRYMDGAKISFFSHEELKDLITLIEAGIEHIEEYNDQCRLNYELGKHKTDLMKLKKVYERYEKFHNDYFKELKA